MMNNNSSNFFNENTFTFDSNKLGALIRTVYEFICDRVSLYKTLPVSAADEIRKFRELLDINAISQEEYNAIKKKLLSVNNQ